MSEKEDSQLETGQPAVSKDDRLLITLGYKPELKRNFSILQVFGIAFSIMSLLPSIASVLWFNVAAGGVGMTWGWLIPSCCILSVGVAMSELGSAMPTSGGLYWWTFKFAPAKVKKPLCWLAGYANTLGLIGGLCGIDYGFAEMFLSVPAITRPDFSPNKYETYGIFVACVLSHMAVGCVATKHLSKLQTFCIVINLLVIVITVIALPIGTVQKRPLNSASFVYANKNNMTTWTYGWSFILAWLSPIWTIGAFDSCVHMSEEAANAATAVPFGIILSISMCGILGFFIMSILAACINPNTNEVLATALGQPMAQIYLDSLGPKWTQGMMIMLYFVQWFMGLSILIAASRQTWAFSRDDALPFSSFIKKINYKTGTPARALLFDGAIAIFIGMLVLIDSAAANALFSLAVGSNGLAWLLSIASRHIVFDKSAFKPGPFYLGHFWSRVNGLFASTYLSFAIFCIATFPTGGPNPTANEMNYSAVIFAAVWGGSLIYYFVDGRKWFEGPKITATELYIAEEPVSGSVTPQTEDTKESQES